MTWLLMIRHGITSWNVDRRVQGHTDVPLSEHGRKILAEQSVPQAFASFRVVSSPLRRASQTAEMLNCPVELQEPALMEMSWGDWEGRTLDSLRMEEGTRMQLREARGLDFQPPGGESPRQVQARLLLWFRQLARDGRPTLAFTHKGVIRAGLALACNWDMLGRMPVRLDWRRGHLFRLGADGAPRLVEPNICLAREVQVPGLQTDDKLAQRLEIDAADRQSQGIAQDAVGPLAVMDDRRMGGATERMNRQRFVELWRRCPIGAGAGDASAVFDQIRDYYSEDWRRYHTPVHLEHCLDCFDRVRHLLRQPDSVEMALWFHDTIYDTQADDNEDRSADWFQSAVGRHSEPAFAARVRELILATKHNNLPSDNDAGFMVDIDLSSFGLPWEQFLDDSNNVRDEYRHLSDADFYRGQLQFLRYLLGRSSFFASPYFREHYEARARANLKRKMEDLAKLGHV